MKRLALSVLAVLFLLTGCGHPLIPASALKPPTVTPTPSDHSATTDAAIGAVNTAAKPLLGVDLYAISNYTAAQTTEYANTMVGYIQKTLKANAVSIVWNFYATSRSANTVIKTRNTLSAANVKIVTQVAQAHGLKVIYRPIIFTPHHGWEGRILPANPARWFRNYFRVELPYIRVAQQLHVTAFVADTEMHYLNRSPRWAAFYRRIAGVYHGIVTYAAWKGDYFPPNAHLQPVANKGMDYYEADRRLRASSPLWKVVASWNRWFSKVSPRVRQATMMHEVGIEARAGAYASPWDLAAKGRLAQSVQANWFTAACRMVHKYNMRGVFFWKVDLADHPYTPTKALSVFEGRQGATAIANCAKILGVP